MIDDRTKNFKIPKPHESNQLQDDVGRFRQALDMIDEVLEESAAIEDVNLLPDTFKKNKIYALPARADYVADTNLGIRQIVVSESDVEDSQIQDGQLVFTPARDVLKH